MSSDEQCDVLDEEEVLAKKIKQMLVKDGAKYSDPDDEIVKRKIKERLEVHSRSPAKEKRGRKREEQASNVDLFDSDDASSDDPTPVRTRRPKSSSSSSSPSSGSDASESDRGSGGGGRRRPPRRRRRSKRCEAMDDTAVQTIYAELQGIHMKLQMESAALKLKEEQLNKRESKLRQAEEMYSEILENEKKEALEEIETVHQRDMDQLNDLYREKCRETKRLRENFDTIKSTNDTLKNQLETLTGRHEKLERQSSSLQSRLTNLQRVQSHAETKISPPKSKPTEKVESEVKPKPKPKSQASMSEVLAVLLDWLSETQLQEVTRATVSGTNDKTFEQSLNRAVKILPHLADLVRDSGPHPGKMDLPCAQFIHWCLYEMDLSQGMHRTTLSSTLRRLGEEFYRSKSLTFEHHDSEQDTNKYRKPDSGRFFRSDDIQERFLSSLVILKTLTQADIVAHVFDALKCDLKENLCKDFFIHYKAMNVLLTFFKPANQSLLSSTCDVLLQLSMESRVLDEFLKACSSETWFRQCAVVLKSPLVDRKIIEKLSVVLQKLSKIRANRRLLDTYGITSAVQDLLRECRDENAFLALNLKSIQYNLMQKAT